MKSLPSATKARQRAELILKVRSGQLTAKAAAQMLGISRQQYYQWEQRALRALLSALEDQPPGRPKIKIDPASQALQIQIEQLQARVRHYEQKEKLRSLLKQMESRSVRDSAKKKTKRSAVSSTSSKP
jgi:transposase